MRKVIQPSIIALLIASFSCAAGTLPVEKIFFHPAAFVLKNSHQQLASSVVKNTSHTRVEKGQWIDMGWPSSLPNNSMLSNGLCFDSQGNAYAVVQEGINDDTAEANQDVFVTMFSKGAWKVISPVYGNESMTTTGAPIAVSMYNNKPYVFFAKITDPKNPEASDVTVSVYTYNGEKNWVAVPNSEITFAAKDILRADSGMVTSHGGKLAVLQAISPGNATVSLYDPAVLAWKNISTTLPAGDIARDISFDAAENIYLEYGADKGEDFSIANAGIQVYDISSGVWNKTIPSFATIFPQDDQNFLGSKRYFVGAKNTFYSIDMPSEGASTAFYQNVEGAWLTNNPITLPADGLYPNAIQADAFNGLYTLVSDADTTEHVEYYSNGIWTNLGAGPSTASVAGMNYGDNMDPMADTDIITNQNTVYVAGVEKATKNITLLKFTKAD